jgi:anti-sigma factor ChrR (cupin superfamily)
MQPELSRHIDEETLDLYARRLLSPARERDVEMHLLWCRTCQDEFHLTEAFIAAIQGHFRRRAN